MKTKHPFLKLWGIPLLLGVLSLAGLLSALIGDGAADQLSWLCLGIPVLTGLYYAGK